MVGDGYDVCFSRRLRCSEGLVGRGKDRDDGNQVTQLNACFTGRFSKSDWCSGRLLHYKFVAKFAFIFIRLFAGSANYIISWLIRRVRLVTWIRYFEITRPVSHSKLRLHAQLKLMACSLTRRRRETDTWTRRDR